MGTGTSRYQRTGNANVDSTVTKINAFNVFRTSAAELAVKPAPVRKPSRREDIYDFVKKQKAAKEEAWHAQSNEDKASTQPENPSGKHTDIYDVITEEDADLVINHCGICAEPTGVLVDGYPCRVCGRTYHKTCVTGSNWYTPRDMKLYENARTAIGWSCEFCDNLSNLLTAKEIDKLAEEFETVDVNKDNTVSLDEFLAFWRTHWQERESRPMPDEEEQFQRIQFHGLDADNSGSIDYWEFIKHGASLQLARRPKEDLVALLTPIEKRSARKVYDILDVNKDGVISEDEARQAYRAWYSHLDYISKNVDSASPKRKKRRKKKAAKDEVTEMIPVGFHTSQSVDHLLEADESNDGEISWEEFLRHQALYIIASRPNRVNLDEKRGS